MIVPATPDSIRIAAEQLRACDVVAIPTETVYGLACSIECQQAIARVFALKGRPADNPLIVHVASIEQALELANAVDHDVVRRLGTAFWPGPLTVVVRRSANVSDAVTAGLDTVALRMPAHPVTLEIIRLAGVALAAPSANLSGRPSPTRAQHVEDDLGDAVMVVDAGPSQYGLESTVVRLIGDDLVILRQGAVSAAALESILQGTSVRTAHEVDDRHRSPGTRHRHYAPRIPVMLCRDRDEFKGVLASIPDLRVQVLCSLDAIADLAYPDARVISASTVFDEFRRAEALQVDRIVVLCDDRLLSDAALMNRLETAAGNVDFK
ncbi:MAG: threonylcarbamoyl-AMP synthase [Candidatus Kapabacteria bacterium]|nr:threonylcarbamoyl-AMP synthase [Candidatus Kapabacteria bacterium]